MKKQLFLISGLCGLLTFCFSAHSQFIPGDVTSVGLSYVVPDMAVWYNTNQLPGHPFPGYQTNGPVDLAAQFPTISQANGNWEPYVSVMGNSTFLIGSGTLADDGSWNGSTNLIGIRPNQRYIITFQSATGGAPKNGEVFYDDFGQPYRLHVCMRQRNPSARVAGDKRVGATNFLAGGAGALQYGKFWYGIDYFNTDGRYSTNYPLYGTGFGSMCNQDCAGSPPGTTDFQSVSVQSYSLNPTTLAQTPVTNAFDATYALSWRNSTPVELCNIAGLPCGNGGAGSRNESYFGGELAALDNGNYVVVVDDYTGFIATNRLGLAATVATIIQPNGTVVKDSFLVDPREIWSNVAAFAGGFCVRVQNSIYFYDNAGNLLASNGISAALNGGMAFQTGRGDEHRIASDIRSHYVYLASPVPVTGGPGVGLGIWNGTNGVFITNAVVSSDLTPSASFINRVGLGVDAYDRILVAFGSRPDNGTFIQEQIVARVLKFDGANVRYLTPSFFPFTNSDNSVTIAANGIRDFKTTNPNVSMTTTQACIAAKGIINSTNSPAGGPDTAEETTVYTVINFVPPSITIARSGANVIISWEVGAFLNKLQSSPSVLPTTWTDVSPQPPIVGPSSSGTYSMTVPLGNTNLFFRMVK